MADHLELIQRAVEARRKHLAGHPAHKNDVAMWDEFRALRDVVPNGVEYGVAASRDDLEQLRGREAAS